MVLQQFIMLLHLQKRVKKLLPMSPPSKQFLMQPLKLLETSKVVAFFSAIDKHVGIKHVRIKDIHIENY